MSCPFSKCRLFTKKPWQKTTDFVIHDFHLSLYSCPLSYCHQLFVEKRCLNFFQICEHQDKATGRCEDLDNTNETRVCPKNDTEILNDWNSCIFDIHYCTPTTNSRPVQKFRGKVLR